MKAFDTLETLSHSEEETFEIASRLSETLAANSVIAFYGDLSAGKTTFIKGLISSFANCSAREVNSPTFTYMNIYGDCKKIYHFDLYRLHDAEEFLSMGFDEYFFSEGISCVEWAERIPELLPPNAVSVKMFHENEHTRRIVINPWKNI